MMIIIQPRTINVRFGTKLVIIYTFR